MKNRISKLAAQRVFNQFPESVLEELWSLGRVIMLEEGDVLFNAGEDIGNIYFLLKGSVDILIPDEMNTGDEQSFVNTLVDGDCIGEYGFIDRRPASATVSANSAVELLMLTHQEINSVLETDTQLRAQFYENLLHTLVDRLRNTNIYVDYLKRNRPRH